MDNIPDCCYEYRAEAPAAIVVDTCDDCDRDIYEGDTYYDIDGKIICNDCIRDYQLVGEVE